MKITYTQVGEQLYPNLIMPTKTEQMGYYAQKRQEYLKNHKKATFTTLLTTCKLTEHLMSIQEQAQQMIPLCLFAVLYYFLSLLSTTSFRTAVKASSVMAPRSPSAR